ncbi:hypothetical protein C1645_249693 [Glomus cerebriforme]|uniref:Cytoskeleton-associated protein 2 C-terminal domain-containing protein n=1 Tax=Glomus cerebriforme TaxID=658196 RepID=A0A397TJR9_9GLOM|nr:hypothetical protein C1645_249693 [Glomus cerebriforme]
MFSILEVDWPSHSKKVGILAENIPPREKARYWVERARFEERCMRYEEAVNSYEKALEFNAKPIELVEEEYEKFLERLWFLHEELFGYQDDEKGINDYSNDNDLLDDDLSVLLEYESGIDFNNKEFSEEIPQSNGNIIQEDIEAISETLDNLSIVTKESKVIKNNSSVPEAPDSIDSSLTLLALVKAKKKERKEMGVEKVVTPVRRSARIHRNSHPKDHTPEDRQISMFEENGLAYVPNPALYYNKNLTPLKRSSKKDDEFDKAILEKPKPVSGKKTVTWEDLKEQQK